MQKTDESESGDIQNVIVLKRKQRRELWLKRAVAVAMDDIRSQHTV